MSRALRVFRVQGSGDQGQGPESPIPLKEFRLNHNMKPYII